MRRGEAGRSSWMPSPYVWLAIVRMKCEPISFPDRFSRGDQIGVVFVLICLCLLSFIELLYTVFLCCLVLSVLVE